MASLGERLRKSWSVFREKEDVNTFSTDLGPATSVRPDRQKIRSVSRRTVIPSIINRIGMDVAAVDIMHAKVDANGMMSYVMNDELNQRLRVDANIDQTGREFIQDAVMSMLDEGHVVIVPTKCDKTPSGNIGDIYAWRTGKVKEWFPHHVRVEVYDEDDGKKKEIILPKKDVAIVQNPLYAIMNEPNSTLQRLLKKIALLDYADEQTVSGKLDMIIQLPYTIRTETKREQANKRRKDIEDQLNNSKYGIAYMDATEKVTQLNRSLENNLDNQIKELQNTLYGQLGLTEDVIKGIAKEEEMINYYNRTIEPVLSAIVDEMIRKFLTKTARTQGQSIIFFRNPFALAGANQIKDLADALTRNAILSSNEIRVLLGYMPVDDPKADELSNKNLNESANVTPPPNTRGDEVDNYQEEPFYEYE